MISVSLVLAILENVTDGLTLSLELLRAALKGSVGNVVRVTTELSSCKNSGDELGDASELIVRPFKRNLVRRFLMRNGLNGCLMCCPESSMFTN
jgi:hypothetical protein